MLPEEIKTVLQEITLTELMDLFQNAIKNATEEERERWRKLKLSQSFAPTTYSPAK